MKIGLYFTRLKAILDLLDFIFSVVIGGFLQYFFSGLGCENACDCHLYS